jgi:hypothetical protein
VSAGVVGRAAHRTPFSVAWLNGPGGRRSRAVLSQGPVSHHHSAAMGAQESNLHRRRSDAAPPQPLAGPRQSPPPETEPSSAGGPAQPAVSPQSCPLPGPEGRPARKRAVTEVDAKQRDERKKQFIDAIFDAVDANKDGSIDPYELFQWVPAGALLPDWPRSLIARSGERRALLDEQDGRPKARV